MLLSDVFERRNQPKAVLWPSFLPLCQGLPVTCDMEERTDAEFFAAGTPELSVAEIAEARLRQEETTLKERDEALILVQAGDIERVRFLIGGPKKFDLGMRDYEGNNLVSLVRGHGAGKKKKTCDVAGRSPMRRRCPRRFSKKGVSKRPVSGAGGGAAGELVRRLAPAGGRRRAPASDSDDRECSGKPRTVRVVFS